MFILLFSLIAEEQYLGGYCYFWMGVKIYGGELNQEPSNGGGEY